jgi:hypothetical protein
MTGYFDRYRKRTLPARQGLGDVFERRRNIRAGTERKCLSKYTGRDMSQCEAKNLWPRIEDHKWYLSERLSRDVGFHVAAVDYVENFYEPTPGEISTVNKVPSLQTIKRSANKAIRFYFESKGQTPSF